eukprot:GFKZ01001153.1.p1 GENE.GFKZ01001153.1~~GFKZ01001153.1.p1  ORF type:complete len:688 (-),score=133.28 GFKZ01001153.1:1004-2809(-)
MDRGHILATEYTPPPVRTRRDGNTRAVAHLALQEHERAEDRRRERHARDKLDRATVEQVLDPRTRMILFRLLSKGRLRTLDGCVSTGKEANVYFATAAAEVGGVVGVDGMWVGKKGLGVDEAAPDAGVAVKVFKTSILQFKDRERYVAGEFRFRRGGYQRGSNRKMVQQWAEKEFRNQMRLQEAGVPAPVPLLLKPPVLVMSFFGKDGWPAPRLKDAGLSVGKLGRAYFRVCGLMRRMFRVAKLVHGDLSEYNMLYWKGEVIIIDVSQSVEDDHPMALDFLRRDCANVNDFFRRNGVTVLSVRELFDYVTGEHIGSEKIEEESALSYLIDSAAARDGTLTQWTRQDDEVFMRSFIPRTLQEVDLHAQQFSQRTADELDQNLFAKLTGLTVTQKRERGEQMWAKSRSVSDGTRAANWSMAGEVSDGVDVPNLEIPCVEPATVRTLPAPGKVRLGSSSPCTTNSTRSSTRRQGDEVGEGGRYPKMLEQIRRIDSVGEAGSSSKHSEERERVLMGSLDVEEDEEVIGLYGESEGFEDDSQASLGGDVWIHKDGGDIGEDAFKGLTRKEWKKQVKAANRERRENKVPKHVKKRKETLAKRRRGTK